MMAMANFHIKIDKAGEFRFNLVASNGQVILSSEGYVRRDNCLKGIASVQRHCAEDRFFERTIAADGRYHFNLKAANGEVIGTSQMYADARSMENGILSVRLNAADAGVLNE
jgi:uncharacterized protein YegP (UPF0339 family)